MTIVTPAHRVLSSKLAGRSFQVVTRYGYNPWLARVDSTYHSSSSGTVKSEQSQCQKSQIYPVSTRTYATAATSAGRPKQHTGRTAATTPRKTKAATLTTTKTKTAKKPGPKTAAGKAKVGRKPKTPATAAKAKPKPVKKPAKKAPSAATLLRREKEKGRAKVTALKQAALLDYPKNLPQSAWGIVFSEAQAAKDPSGTANVATKAAGASVKFKNLTPEEKEHYNHLAHQNREKNEIAYKKWLSQYTPTQVREANTARRHLSGLRSVKHGQVNRSSKFPPIHDDRLVKARRTPYILFSADRYASGDLHKMTISECAKLISREWKEADESTKKKFNDLAAADMARYREEYKTVYGVESQPKKPKKTSPAAST